MGTLQSVDVIINRSTFNLLRIYDIFNPRNKKIFGVNVYQLTVISLLIIMQLIFVYGTMAYFIETENTLNEIDWFILTTIYKTNIIN